MADGDGPGVSEVIVRDLLLGMETVDANVDV